MATYYINSLMGDQANDGLSEWTPLETHEGLSLRPGDTVLFASGTSYRHGIRHRGMDGAPVRFGRYGAGEAPRFYGSINRSEPYLWGKTETEHVWRLLIPLKSEPCNVVFDFGDACGVLAWEKSELNAQGKWWSNMLGRHDADSAEFYLYSRENPGKYYADIEISLFGDRHVLEADKNTIFDGLDVLCAGVHGFFAANAENVTLTECRFSFIGGCVYDISRRIRFGNGAEFWNGATNIRVENCLFDNIYDSCLTTQGDARMTPPREVAFVGNTCRQYGMAALEVRDQIGQNVLFELNECVDAGHGFALQGELPPRRSEIYPEPMGHHIFAWRLVPTARGSVTIRRNVLIGRPTGETIYLRTDSETARAQIHMEHNEIR